MKKTTTARRISRRPRVYQCPRTSDSKEMFVVVGCGHTFVGAANEEGHVDCPSCGIWFSPAQEPATIVAEQVPAWVCTDSNAGIKQYGRQLAPGVYEFKEKRNGRAFQKTIALADYTPEQVENEVRAYYDSVADLRAFCAKHKDDADWIIAECLFEQSV